ncbi:helix-turn-helix domain-containing protein [Bacillus songklensis]|uniref:Helix-turn-helix domain-containing protein n=1 Tax=Bacillus songklensis TaxID=1069116 RepID=A0ABV8B5R7_9BACI
MKVLVVENDDFQRNGLKWMLQNSMLSITEYVEVSTVYDFFTVVSKKKVDLIFIDVDLLDGDDWSHLSLAVQRAKVIGTMRSKNFDTAIRCVEAGMHRLFVKPFPIEDLMAVINSLAAAQKMDFQQIAVSGPETLKKQWISKLIYGQVNNLREIWDEAKRLGYQALPSVVMIAKVSRLKSLARNKSDVWKKKMLLDIYRSMESFCFEHGLIASQFDEEFILLYTPKIGEQKDETIQKIKRISYHLLDWVRKESGYALHITAGKEYKNPMHLYYSYQEAKELLSLEFYFSKGKVCTCFDYPTLFDHNVVEELHLPVTEDDLTNYSFELIFSEIEKNMNELKAKGVSPIYYKLVLIDILQLIVNRYVKNEKERFRAFLEQSKKIMSSTSSDELLPQIKEFFAQTANVGQTNLGHIVIEKALDYIRNHYMQSITLEEVSEYVQRSPYYFSHLFKKTMNMTFVEYLTNLRVSKAKELLMQGDWTVSEIASLVGYQDPNYFSRVFKVITGDSPSKWKTQKNLEMTR